MTVAGRGHSQKSGNRREEQSHTECAFNHTGQGLSCLGGTGLTTELQDVTGGRGLEGADQQKSCPCRRWDLSGLGEGMGLGVISFSKDTRISGNLGNSLGHFLFQTLEAGFLASHLSGNWSGEASIPPACLGV